MQSAIYDFLSSILCSLYVHRVLQRLESLCDSDRQIREEMNSAVYDFLYASDENQFHNSPTPGMPKGSRCAAHEELWNALMFPEELATQPVGALCPPRS